MTSHSTPGLTMLIPFFLVTVMGLAYLGAFHQLTHMWSVRNTRIADENTRIREIEEAFAA